MSCVLSLKAFLPTKSVFELRESTDMTSSNIFYLILSHWKIHSTDSPQQRNNVYQMWIQVPTARKIELSSQIFETAIFQASSLLTIVWHPSTAAFTQGQFLSIRELVLVTQSRDDGWTAYLHFIFSVTDLIWPCSSPGGKSINHCMTGNQWGSE